jgi:outer membrane protein assembly factor BamB
VTVVRFGQTFNSWFEIYWGDRRRPLDFSAPISVTIVGDVLVWLGEGIRGYGPNCPVTQFGGPETCSYDWIYSTGSTGTGVAATSATTAVVTATAGTVDSIDVHTAARLWRSTVGAAIVGRPAVVDGTVFVVTADGRLVAIDAAGCGAPTCSPLWEAPLPGTPATGPVAGGDVVYATMAGGDIAAYPAAGCGALTCSSLVTVSVGAEVTGAPIVDEGHLIAATTDGRVVAFGLPG